MVRSLSRRNFAAAAVLSGFAGFVDGFGFSYLGGFFVSFMSGNTTRLSVDLVHGAWPAFALCGLLVVCFVGGAMAGTVLGAARHGSTRVLVLIALALAAAAAVASAAALSGTADLRPIVGALLAVGMGAANTVFSRGGEVSFGITYMTGALVKVGQGLVAAWRGGHRTGWVRHLVLWAAIATGAFLGAGAFVLASSYALWVVVGALALVTAWPSARRWLHPEA
ncbi:hypothetical protein LLS1_33550 [Leifsonia sp. LS1]|uniref:YoaK family protein n=1 Tax=Leifsonia sp. LS1 TaxID=2828483 RepID=UPI001CFD6813|nr:YoaK family protein [Leifsonia sp. LS1]GIT81686.1 hypothetical protein LLS1_33550 [Leifsonia sp. LS1]